MPPEASRRCRSGVRSLEVDGRSSVPFGTSRGAEARWMWTCKIGDAIVGRCCRLKDRSVVQSQTIPCAAQPRRAAREAKGGNRQGEEARRATTEGEEREEGRREETCSMTNGQDGRRSTTGDQMSSCACQIARRTTVEARSLTCIRPAPFIATTKLALSHRFSPAE